MEGVIAKPSDDCPAVTGVVSTKKPLIAQQLKIDLTGGNLQTHPPPSPSHVDQSLWAKGTTPTHRARPSPQAERIDEHPLAKEKEVPANTLDLYFLGITIAVCGNLFSWNAGLEAGFWEFFVCIILTSLAYLIMILSLAEMASALPFNGGMYGFIRLAIGPFVGFIIGCCETLANILCCSTTVLPLGWMITEMTGLPVHYEPIYWVVFYITALYFTISGGKVFWRFNAFICCLSLATIIMFVLGTTQYLDYSKYAYRSHSFSNGLYFFQGYKLLQQLPNATWFYQGVEYLPLAGSTVADPKKSLAKAMVGGIITLIVLSILVHFTVNCQSPGTAENSEFLLPMNTGFSRMFNIPFYAANIFGLPGTYATSFGFLYTSGRQISSMGKSRLFPEYCGRMSSGDAHTPYAALWIAAFVSIVINFMSLSPDILTNFLEDLFLLTLLGSFIVYIWTIYAYIIYKRKFSNLEKQFENPLGTWGAWFSICVFSLGAISTVALQGGNYRVIVIFVGFLLLCTMYYVCYVHARQYFSEEEQAALFQAYVIKANENKKFKRFRSAACVLSPRTRPASIHPSEISSPRSVNQSTSKDYFHSSPYRNMRNYLPSPSSRRRSSSSSHSVSMSRVVVVSSNVEADLLTATGNDSQMSIDINNRSNTTLPTSPPESGTRMK